jgi:exosortase/archaeosortase family protein
MGNSNDKNANDKNVNEINVNEKSEAEADHHSEKKIKKVNPILSLKGKERWSFAIRTILITTVLTAIIYLVPDYYDLENITTLLSYKLLNFFGYSPQLSYFSEPITELSWFDQFAYNLYDPHRNYYPVISISTTVSNSRFIIVRACTGMQAGALLTALIVATPAKTQNKIRAILWVNITLFLGNTLRIAMMVALTSLFMEEFGLSYETSWGWAHDVLAKPIGILGTIGFVLLVEKNKVPILDTMTTWIDSFFDLFDYITGSKKPQKPQK